MTSAVTKRPSGDASDRVASLESPPARRLVKARWSDPRMLAGLVLVVGSLIGVTWVVNAADDRVEVWSVRGDVAHGTTLTGDDVALVRVQLASVAPYLGKQTSPVGFVTTRNFAEGELLAASGVSGPGDAPDLRLITLPVEQHHLPSDLARGEQVDVYLVARAASGEPVGEPRLVLAAATVADVDDGDSRFGGSSLELGIALAVSPDDVEPLVAAEARGTITLVRVPAGAPSTISSAASGP
ncbi:MAG TPA: SAF domain-containing protein [Actinomycetes bacterium]|nr:SAF domain-containing protein [Actinomycetes bacterium]